MRKIVVDFEEAQREMRKLSTRIISERDADRKARLEERYWAFAEVIYGPRRAANFRWEYEWLKAHPGALGRPVTCHMSRGSSTDSGV